MILLSLVVIMQSLESGRSTTSIPWREVDPVYRGEFRSRFPWQEITPDFTGRTSKKIKVIYGDEEDPLDTSIESMAVGDRLTVLTLLARTQKRDEAHALVDSHLWIFQMNEYIKHLIGNMYLELGALEQFLQFAYAREFPGQDLHRSAVAFVEYMISYSEKTLGHSFEFFSARMVMDWLEVFQQRGCFRVEISRANRQIWKSTNLLPPKSMMNLEFGVWKHILKNRLNRLLLTGYENIDL